MDIRDHLSFDRSWLVPTNRDASSWLASRLPLTLLALRTSLAALWSSLSWSEGDCFRALWNDALRNSWNLRYASNKSLLFYQNWNSTLLKPRYEYFKFVSTGISWSSFNQTGVWHWKWIPVFVTVLSVLFDHSRRHSTAQPMSLNRQRRRFPNCAPRRISKYCFFLSIYVLYIYIYIYVNCNWVVTRWQ